MDDLRPGDPTQVGDYRLLGRLGAGGMGQVFLGRSRRGRTVAVKLVHAQLAHDPEFRRRFRAEVAAARRVGGSGRRRSWTPTPRRTRPGSPPDTSPDPRCTRR